MDFKYLIVSEQAHKNCLHAPPKYFLTFDCCQNLVFAILIADNQLVTMVRMKKYSLQASDLHLIFNLVSSSESFKAAESWTPICLPNFDSR